MIHTFEICKGGMKGHPKFPKHKSVQGVLLHLILMHNTLPVVLLSNTCFTSKVCFKSRQRKLLHETSFERVILLNKGLCHGELVKGTRGGTEGPCDTAGASGVRWSEGKA